MKYLQTISILLLSLIGQAQNTFFKSIYIPESNNAGWTIIAEENGFIVSSGSLCFDSDIVSCTHIIKTDIEGTPIWTKLLDISPQSTGGFGSLQKVEGENYIVNGAIHPLYANEHQGRMLKLDTQGDTLWSAVYGDTLNSFMAWTTHELESGNMLTLGWNGQLNDEKYVPHIAKYTSDGELLFIKTIDIEYDINLPAQITPADDENLLVSFQCRGIEPSSRVPATAKVDTSGNVLSIKEWPEWDVDCFTWANPTVVSMEDGGYVLPWCFDRPDIHPYHTTTMLMRFDANNEMLWELPLFGDNNYVNDTILSINSVYIHFVKKAANGDFLLVGFDHNSALEDIGSQGYLSRVSPEGELLWRRLYVFSDQLNGGSSILYNLDEKDDGYIAMTGVITDTLVEGNGVTRNVVLMVVDEEGCINSGCTGDYIYLSNFTSTEEAVKNYKEIYFRLSPNPASVQEIINIHFYNPINSPDYRIFFYTLDGRLVYEHKPALGVQNIDIPLSNLTSGVYFAFLKQEGRIVQQKKFVVK
jgi:hypothetical protein